MTTDDSSLGDVKRALSVAAKRAVESQTSLAIVILGMVGVILGVVIAYLPVSTNIDGVVTECGSVFAPTANANNGAGLCGTAVSGHVARAACAMFGGLGFLVVLLSNGFFARLFTLIGAASIAATTLGVLEGTAHLIDALFVAYAFAMVWFTTRYWSGRVPNSAVSVKTNKAKAKADGSPSDVDNKAIPKTAGSQDDNPTDLSSILGKPKRK